MLASVTDLQGFTLRAMDGEIGKVDQFYFDDETWAIRYLVVNTGSWLAGRLVLISPFAVGQTDWESKQLEVALTKKQVEGSPDIDTHKPVSRQHEAEYLGYYGYPFYWEGPYGWGSMTGPAGLAVQSSVVAEASASRAETESADSHLRSTKEVTGYHIEATDGEIGHVENFISSHLGYPIHRGGYAELVAWKKGTGVTPLDRTRELDGFQSLRGPLPGNHQERSGVY